MKKKKARVTTLRESLSYEPVELAFGTSGLRGLVSELTNLEAYVNVRGFLSWLAAGAAGDALGSAPGRPVFVAGDLRPSTASLVATPTPRGALLQAACRAIADEKLTPVFLGTVPTPALVLHAMKHNAPAVMVTGSHIPADRNGLKLTTPGGEVTRADEQPILAAVHAAREREYSRPEDESPFGPDGMFRGDHAQELPPVSPGAAEEYIQRCLSAFPAGSLSGARILVWQHSSVSRDILPAALEGMGAEVISAGRNEDFMAVDTEAVDEPIQILVQSLVDEAGGAGRGIEAVVSTDGDGDRPLLFVVENGRARFLPGDLLGALAAGFLGARHAAVPVNVNDAVDEYCLGRGIEVVKTRIGSPHVIAALQEAAWEANGGFLTAVPLGVPGGGTLEALPTRDSLLPILAVLSAARHGGLPALVSSMPSRFGLSAVVRDFPGEMAREIMRWLSPADPGTQVARFEGGTTEPLPEELATIRARAARFLWRRALLEPSSG